MKELFRSSDVTALLLKKQILAENGVSSRILYDGNEIMDAPQSPRYGTLYHLDHNAILVVDDEQEQAAYDCLDAIEIPDASDEPIRNRFGQTGEDVQNAYRSTVRWIARLIILGFIALIVYLIIRY